MIIALGNSKGGVGCTSMSLLLANYLSRKKGHSLSLIELNENGPLEDFDARSKLLEQSLPFEFFRCSLALLPALIDRLTLDSSHITLIDLPSVLASESLLLALRKLEQIIIPFSYDKATLNASIYFCCFLKRVKADQKILFLPNRISYHLSAEHRYDVNEVLRDLAPVMPAIVEHIGFGRISSLLLDEGLLEKARAALDIIYLQYLF